MPSGRSSNRFPLSPLLSARAEYEPGEKVPTRIPPALFVMVAVMFCYGIYDGIKRHSFIFLVIMAGLVPVMWFFWWFDRYIKRDARTRRIGMWIAVVIMTLNSMNSCVELRRLKHSMSDPAHAVELERGGP